MQEAEPKPNYQLRRRLIHIFGAPVLPIASFFLPHATIVALTAAGAAIMLVGDVARLSIPTFNAWTFKYFGFLLKKKERRQLNGATQLSVAGFIGFTFFAMPIPALGFLFLAVGDPAASYLGARFGRIRIGRKSLEGTLAFVAVSLGAAVVLWRLNVYQVLWPAVVGAVVAALTELLPTPVDDNLTVPLVSTIVMSVLWVA